MGDNGGDDGNNDRKINRWNGHYYSDRYFQILEKRSLLRVWRHKKKILQSFKNYQILILAAETGSGKTTQIPQFVLEAIHGTETTPPLVDILPNQKMMVACTLPDPMAVIHFSHIVALEMDLTIGQELVLRLGSQDCASANTILKYLTDDVLLWEARTDTFLKNYKVIILDEAHQRTLVKDILFGYLKEVLKHRPDLKLVLMTGTITEAANLKNYFSAAQLVEVPGGHHVVEIYYLKEEPDEEKGGYMEEAIKKVVEIHMDEDPGDILVFLAEPNEMEVACLEIIERVKRIDAFYGPVKVVPLYSMSPLTMQQVYEPALRAMEEGGPPGRKIVVTTNIAETSLTIGGIVYVVDCGYARRKKYNRRVHAEYVQVSLISKESAEERSRQAGKTRPGKCFRMYTKKMFDNVLKKTTKPEIKRSNLAITVLTLKKLGINDLDYFDFMDRPAPEMLTRALEVLNYLGALDDEWKLTRLGEIMSEFPLDPQMSKMLVLSPGFNCSNEILSISAMLSAPDCFVHPNRENQEAAAKEAKARFNHSDGDHITLLNVYHAYKENIGKPYWCHYNFVNARALEFADYLRQQLMRTMSKFNLKLCSTDLNSPDYHVNIRKAILAGFFMQVAHLKHNGHYFTVKDNQKVYLHPSSLQDHRPEWVVYNECFLGTTFKENIIRTVTPVCKEWLFELVPRHYWENLKKDKKEGE